MSTYRMAPTELKELKRIKDLSDLVFRPGVHLFYS